MGRERGSGTNTVLFVLLALLFVFAIVDFVLLYFKNEQDRRAVGYTTSIQVTSQQLATYAAEAAAGNELAFEELKTASNNINTYVQNLNTGERVMPGYANEAGVANDLAGLTKAWTQLQTSAKKI